MVTVPDSSGNVTEGRKCRVGISFYVRVLWGVLSILVSVACTYSFFKPQWFINPSTDLCLGIINFCYEDRKFHTPPRSPTNREIFDARRAPDVDSPESRYDGFVGRRQFNRIANRFDPLLYKKEKIKICRQYGGSRFRLHHLPSSPWQIACITFGGGCLVGCSAALLSLVTITIKPIVWNKRMACFTALLQSSAALLFTTGLMILPLGMESKLSHYICKSSSPYDLGRCSLGWPYILSAVSTALSFFCPFLSRHINLDKTISQL